MINYIESLLMSFRVHSTVKVLKKQHVLDHEDWENLILQELEEQNNGIDMKQYRETKTCVFPLIEFFSKGGDKMPSVLEGARFANEHFNWVE